MRIGAVITIVGAHEARNAASRLTMPVSDGSCRAGRQAAPAPFLRRSVAAGRWPAVAEDAAAGPSRPRKDVMTEPAAPYPYPYPYSAPTGPGSSPDGTVPPMPSEVTNERRQRHSDGRLRVMMRKIARRP